MKTSDAKLAITLASALAAGLVAPALAQQGRPTTTRQPVNPRTPSVPSRTPPVDPSVRPASGSTSAAGTPRTVGGGNVPALAIPPGNPAPGAGGNAPGMPPKPATADQKVYRSSEEIPRSDIVPGDPNIVIQGGAVDPFLVQPENGPFMVMAKSFVGPDATRFAVALTRELREQFHLPAYIFYIKVHPGKSNVRGVPPTAPPAARNGDQLITQAKDEAAVLVGNYKTTDDAYAALKKIKKLHPVCLDGMPSFWHRRGTGLKYALMTTNPLAASQNLYPGREVTHHGGESFNPYDAIAKLQNRKPADKLVVQMNSGDHSIYNCPGPFTLQVAEFTGRTTTNPDDPRFKDDKFVGSSPLGTAFDDAEKLAENLKRHGNLLGGHKPYVYHDRTCSKVLVGSFKGQDDPALQQLVKRINDASLALMVDKRVGLKLPLTAVPVLCGTPEGASVRDNMIQQTSASTNVPDIIPFPAR